MLVTYSDGKSGIFEYLETGQKRGRVNTRDELDKRVCIAGNDKVTKEILAETGVKYKHISLSFKEDDLSQEEIESATKEYLKFLFKGYREDEYNVYAEIHFPKIKNLEKDGELITRKPHVHIVIPQINLLTGKALEPLGYVKSNILYNDAFVELYNAKNGLASPKENHSNKLPMFDRNNDVKQEILSKILEKNITRFEDMQEVLKPFGISKLTENAKAGDYWNVKPAHEDKYIRLKDYLFSKEFIEMPLDKKMTFIKNEEALRFVEKSTKKSKADTKKWEKDLAYWNDVRALEIKYINPSSKFYKTTYKEFTKEQKIDFLAQKEKNFYEKSTKKDDVRVPGVLDDKTIEDIKIRIENEPRSQQREVSIPDFTRDEFNQYGENRNGLRLLSSSDLVHSKTRAELLLRGDEVINISNRNVGRPDKNLRYANQSEPTRAKSEIEAKINIVENDGLRSSHIPKVEDKEIVDFLSSNFDKRRYLIQNDKVIAGDREFTISEFLEHLHIDMKQIIEIEQTINKMKEDLEMKKEKEIKPLPQVKVNILMQEKNEEQVAYYQIGKQNEAKQFTGLVYDLASKNDIAAAYISNNKVVSESMFMREQGDLYRSITAKDKELFVPVIEERTNYITLPMDILNPSIDGDLGIKYQKQVSATLTDMGKVYANSKHNFKEIEPIQMGKSVFAKKADKNFWEIAKDVVTLQSAQYKVKNLFIEAKDKIKEVMENRKDLAASNVILAAELRARDIKLDNIKTYQEALDIQKKAIEKAQEQEVQNEVQNERKIDENFKLKDAIELVEDLHKKKEPVQEVKQQVEQEQEKPQERQTVRQIDDKFSLKDAINLIEEVQNAKERLETVKDLTTEEAQELAKTAYQKVKIMFEKEDITPALDFFVKNKEVNKFYDFVKDSNDLDLLKASNTAIENGLKFEKTEDLVQFRDMMMEGVRIALNNNIEFIDVAVTIISKTKDYLQNKLENKLEDSLEDGIER